MSEKSFDIYLDDMIECMDKIQRYVKGLDFEGFSKNDMVIDAVMRNLEVIGEASKNIPEHARETYNGIPWKEW